MENFRIRLKQAVESNGLSVKQFAEKSGMPYATLAKYMNGTRSPGMEQLAAIVTSLNISADWLLFGNGEKNPGHSLMAMKAAVKQLVKLRKDEKISDEKLEKAFLIMYRDALHSRDSKIDEALVDELYDFFSS
ncbi:helix-turn-helix transcriptional regulator [Neisseriaceae bacterium TC5R-5]|nr:helix-turn-helix transcriptional regulator [Neisseriaceae bacterium TC5R-5]